MDLERIDPEEAKRRAHEEGWTLLDVRSMPEFAEEHAEGAYNVPFLHKTPNGMVPNPDFARVIAFLFPDKDAKIISHCQMGGRSVRASMELQHMGYTQVVDMRGGFGGEKADDGSTVNPGWKDLELPVEVGEPADRSYKALALKMNQADEAPDEVAAPASEAPPPVESDGLNRFASASRNVFCIRYQQQLPGMKRRPYPGDLGQRLFDEVSAAAWNDWVEHSKMIINEYRINAADPQALQVLMEQCEQFFYGQGVQRPEGYVPQQ